MYEAHPLGRKGQHLHAGEERFDHWFVASVGERPLLAKLDKLNFNLCRVLLHRRFAKFPRDERFHAAAFFQGFWDAPPREGASRGRETGPVFTPWGTSGIGTLKVFEGIRRRP
jgi:hypothetical protein